MLTLQMWSSTEGTLTDTAVWRHEGLAPCPENRSLRRQQSLGWRTRADAAEQNAAGRANRGGCSAVP